MKKLLIASLLLTGLSAQAGIVKAKNTECATLFKVDDTIKRGQKGSHIVSDKVTYGIISKDLIINFDDRVAEVRLDSAVTLGFNKTIKRDVFISGDHPKFNEFIDNYRKDLIAMKSVCLSKNGEILDFSTN